MISQSRLESRVLTRRRPAPYIVHITPHVGGGGYRNTDMIPRDVQMLRLLMDVLFAEDRDPFELDRIVTKCGNIDVIVRFYYPKRPRSL